jgi:uncharacterized protein (DUF58 family)
MLFHSLLKRRSFDLPPFSNAHDATWHTLVQPLGLAKTWNILGERFTTVGRGFLVVTAVFFVSGVNSLELQAHVPLLYAACLWIITLAFVFLAKPRANLKTHFIERICAGETLPVEVTVESKRPYAAGQLRVTPYYLPPAIEVVPYGGAPVPEVTPEQSVVVRMALQPKRRGVYRIPGWRIETDFPFGLMRSWAGFAGERRLLVYPRFRPLGHFKIEAGRQFQPGGLAMVSHTGDSFEFQGNREYRDGDSVRDIDWRATARLSRPIVREYREEFFLRAAVVLDTHISPQNDEGAREAFERAVSLCAAVGEYMARSDYIVDLLAAGPNLYHLVTGRSEAYLDQILDILACVEESPETPFALLEPEITQNLGQINTIICLFLDWDEERRAFVEALQREGAGLKVLIVRDVDCSLDPYSGPFAALTTVLTSQQVDSGMVAL